MSNNWKRVVDLVEKGDADPILAEESLAEIYKELVKYGMVSDQNGRPFLTQKGNEARLKGIMVGIEQMKVGEELTDFSEKKGRLGSTFFFISLFLFLMSLTLFIIINFTTYTLWS